MASYVFLFLFLVCSIGLGWLTIVFAKHTKLGTDESSGVQKFHSHRVARLGGVPVFVSFAMGACFFGAVDQSTGRLISILLACSLPAFAIGLWEDLTRKTGVMPRLLVTMIAAVLAWHFLEAQILRLDLPWVDTVLRSSVIASVVLTAIAVAGLAHAVNIIDGYNGLCGFFSLLAFSAIAMIAYLHGDDLLTRLSAIAAFSIVAFLFWNYPMGRLFLGDAGAYFIGFLIAEFGILLVLRNPAISAWCVLLIVIYPVWETLFSMFRRAHLSGLSHVGKPDALHLHQLVHRRLMKRYQADRSDRAKIMRNAMTTPYLLVLVLMSVVPAVAFSEQPLVLFGFCMLFVATYIASYRAIVHFRVPHWVVMRALRKDALPPQS